MAENTDKSTSECLQLLIHRLCQLQHGLRPTLQTIDFLYNKIVTSCQGIPACRYAVSDPLNNLRALINKLQLSIIAYEKEHVEKTQAFFID